MGRNNKAIHHKEMKNIIIILFCLLFCTFSSAQSCIKVSCIGNSITYGATIENREVNAYPAQLQRMLGGNYEVKNFGKPGATLLSKGHRPYMQQEEYRKAIDFAGDIAVIHLGINDTDPRDWPQYHDYFIKDYLALIDSLRLANQACRIIIARLTPISDRHHRFESGTRDWHDQIQIAIEAIARIARVQLMDFHAPLYSYPFLLPDGVHPNAEGAGVLAKNVYSAITGDFGGLRLSQLYTNNMVLQHGRPLVIRGNANAADKVTVSIANRRYMTKTPSNGQWSVAIQPLKAGGPYTLTVATEKQKLEYTNILAGEVWLCSGQSNMEFMLKETSTANADIAAANNNQIRLFDMKARWQTNAVEWKASVLDSLNHLQYYKEIEWAVATPQTAASFSAVAYTFGKMLQDSLHIPVGLICNAIGGSPTEAWIDRNTLEFHFPAILRNWRKNDFIQDWVRGRAELNIKKSEVELQRHPYEPCYLFEAGIRPLEQYPISGVIWYQGESNAHNYEAHEKLFQLLVNSWRKNWGNESLPFYYVQLSSLNRPSWPWFRNSQREMMVRIPETGMAVSSDYGDSLNVHPANKRPIGERLARWALSKAYGMPHVVPSGPLFKSADFYENAVYLKFDYGVGLRSSDNLPLRTFEVAQTDGLYYPAVAEVVGDSIKVSSDKVRYPRYVRYGWQPFTIANLVNETGLPASTFKAEAAPAFIRGVSIQKMQGFPQRGAGFEKGVSACYAGWVNGKVMMAGGCNFPGTPASEGGKKKFYQDIYLAELDTDTSFVWSKVGKLPVPAAYGVSVSIPEGIICVGGNNEKGGLTSVYIIRWNEEKKKTLLEMLPSLPYKIDNMCGALVGHCLWIAGGNKEGAPSNSFLSLDLNNLSAGWQALPEFPGAPRIQAVCVGQQKADESVLYLWGGFAPSAEGRPATLSTDGYCYSSVTKKWTTIATPTGLDGNTISLGGGTAIAINDSLIMCAGGVNKDIFKKALQYTEKDYLLHPAEWYRFNDRILVYNIRLDAWQEIARTSDIARAGAALIGWDKTYFTINGELKPGVRTPGITKIMIE